MKAIACAVSILLPLEAFCCTSVIISGKVRSDGRPVMLKHRDSGEMNNSIQRFDGPEYSFIGLVNDSSKGGEVWCGTNSAGFCIMNTAAYDMKDDDVPASEMDREGEFMYKALGLCSDLFDFEKYLDTLRVPFGVEANFGIIDSKGGAAYYEIDNSSWVRYDVAGEPGGYMFVTNFTRRGRPQDRRGVDRYEKACAIMEGLDVSSVGHEGLFNGISRSGDPILRDITSSSIVFEGVPEGGDPSSTVMWTLLGCPTTSIYLPLKVFSKDHIPSFMKNDLASPQSNICSNSLIIKGIYGYRKGVADECRKIEKNVDAGFSNTMSPSKYDSFIRKCYRRYRRMCRGKLPKVGV